MTEPTLYRIVEENPYLGAEDDWGGLTLDEAAHKMDDLTSCGADVILADFDEDCTACHGTGEHVDIDRPEVPGFPCKACACTGKRSEPWEWTDPETGREVTLRLEVS